MTALEQLIRSRVQEILEGDFGAVTADADACWVLMERGPVRVKLITADEYVVIGVDTLAVKDVPRSPELYQWVAEEREQAPFGHVRLVAADSEDRVNLIVLHELLGNHLDHAELVFAVVGVASVAASTADEVAARFGGVVRASAPES